eukprot:14357391-Alexandrium_andersonii.AAC.1
MAAGQDMSAQWPGVPRCTWLVLAPGRTIPAAVLGRGEGTQPGVPRYVWLVLAPGERARDTMVVSGQGEGML